MRLGAVLPALVLSVACSALCQQAGDEAAYANFFSLVSSMKGAMDRAPAGRDANGNVFPRLQDKFGLTDAEVETLNAIALDCESASASLDERKLALNFESRLEFIDTGKHMPDLDLKLKEVDGRKNQMVLDHVRELKNKLPQPGFARIDAFVHKRGNQPVQLGAVTSGKPGPAADQSAAGKK